MKNLKIKNGKGYFINKDNEEITIDKISKEDILFLLDTALTDENFEMDPYDENLLHNEAHSIIYKSLYSKLSDFIKNKIRFKDTINNLYKDEIKKYSLDD